MLKANSGSEEVMQKATQEKWLQNGPKKNLEI